MKCRFMKTQLFGNGSSKDPGDIGNGSSKDPGDTGNGSSKDPGDTGNGADQLITIIKSLSIFPRITDLTICRF